LSKKFKKICTFPNAGFDPSTSQPEIDVSVDGPYLRGFKTVVTMRRQIDFFTGEVSIANLGWHQDERAAFDAGHAFVDEVFQVSDE